MDNQLRCEIYRKVRACLVRHWIDIGALHILVGPYLVKVSGILRRITGLERGLDSAMIEVILKEIRMIRGVRNVEADFDNWIYHREHGWMLKHEAARKVKRGIVPLTREAPEGPAVPLDE